MAICIDFAGITVYIEEIVEFLLEQIMVGQKDLMEIE